MIWRLPAWLRAWVLMGCGAAFLGVAVQGLASAQFEMDFTDARQTPAHWVLKLNPDGSGSFDTDGGNQAQGVDQKIIAGDVHRTIQLSAALTGRIFATARAKKYFAFPCESNLKVAFQGTKRFSYTGPEGSGSCEFNYSKDKEIEELQNSLLAVQTTILCGARLEKLLQHDRLGLDEELGNLTMWAHDGSAQEMGAIRETLTRIASDEEVMDRARKKARFLLTQAQ
jgi:hypothetical protein